VGAWAASKSVVKTVAPSSDSAFLKSGGNSSWAEAQSTAQTTASSSACVAVAKCAATNGENVQSSRRVGSP